MSILSYEKIQDKNQRIQILQNLLNYLKDKIQHYNHLTVHHVTIENLVKNSGRGARETAAAISYLRNKHGDQVYKEMYGAKKYN